MSNAKKKYSEGTIAAQAGVDDDPAHGSVMPPLYLSSNYSFEGYEKKRPYDYSRSGNPTRDVLGQALADLEGGFGGVITASGMAAVHLPLYLLEPGDLLVAPHDCYGGTYRLLDTLSKKGHFELAFVNQTDSDAVKEIFTKKPRMVLIETPSNPLLRVSDVEMITALAKKCGAISVADNTFLSPVLQQPVSMGVDIVIHSTTKYINGHSDVVGGAVISATPELHEKMVWWSNTIGTTGAPFDSYMTLRGLRTLGVRMEKQQETAGKLAEFLNRLDVVNDVNYPGLSTHSGHNLAGKQQKGPGAMLSFELKGGAEDVVKLIDGLELFTLAESLGGVESLIAHPATMTHATMDEDAQLGAGITKGLLRISVGLEDPDDLIADLKQAFSKL